MKICLAGYSLFCFLGDSASAVADALLDSRRPPVPFAPEYQMPVFTLPDFDHQSDNHIRCTQSLDRLADDALAQAFPGGVPADARIGCIVGTTGGVLFSDFDFFAKYRQGAPVSDETLRAFSTEPLAEHLARQKHWLGPAMTISNTCTSGADAVATGAQWLLSNFCDIVVAIGIELLTKIPMTGFFALGAADKQVARPFDRDRAGMNVGEGGACVVMTRENFPGARSSHFYLRGAASACDAYHVTAPDPDGIGISKAFRNALQSANLTAADIAFICAHGTGTIANDLCEGKAISTIFGKNVNYFSSNAMTGHLLGAAGIAKLIIALELLDRQMIPPSYGCINPDPQIPVPPVMTKRAVSGRFAMTSSLAFGGINTVLIAERV